MILQTSRFGEIKIKDDEVFHFENGLPGFKAENKFFLVTVENSPFMYLQSLNDSQLSFIVVSPFDFFESYELTLTDQVQQELGIEKEEQVRIVNIINVRGELAKATINLGAPIVLNTTNHKGMQYILPNGQYSIQQPLFGKLIDVERGR